MSPQYTFAAIPHELLDFINQFSDALSLFTCRAVSRAWRNAVAEPSDTAKRLSDSGRRALITLEQFSCFREMQQLDEVVREWQQEEFRRLLASQSDSDSSCPADTVALRLQQGSLALEQFVAQNIDNFVVEIKVIGPAGAGKSALVHRFLNRRFDDSLYDPTMEDLHIHKVSTPAPFSFDLSIFDTGDFDEFDSIVLENLFNATQRHMIGVIRRFVIFLCVPADCSDAGLARSLELLQKAYLNNYRAQHLKPFIDIVLVITQLEMTSDSAADAAANAVRRIEAWAYNKVQPMLRKDKPKAHPNSLLQIVKTSAKDNLNVRHLFEDVVLQCVLLHGKFFNGEFFEDNDTLDSHRKSKYCQIQ